MPEDSILHSDNFHSPLPRSCVRKTPIY